MRILKYPIGNSDKRKKKERRFVYWRFSFFVFACKSFILISTVLLQVQINFKTIIIIGFIDMIKPDFANIKDAILKKKVIYMIWWMINTNRRKLMHSQICIKRSHLRRRKSGLLGQGDLLKEVQFIWNVLWQDKENVTFYYRWLLNRGDHMWRFC
jgi:hypothetical protein